MNPRTTTGRRGAAPRARRRPPATVRRPALYLGVAAAGAILVNAFVGVEPTAQAEGEALQSVSVAEQLGLSAQATPIDVTEDLEPLEDLAVSRSARAAEQTAAQQVQAAADQAELDRQKAEAEAAARAEAEAKAAAEAAAAEAAAEAAAQAEAAAAPAPAGRTQAREAAPAASSVAATAVARISNSSGSVRSQVQAAADAVVSNVSGAAGITLGGTRPSAADPNGHPSGLALDYMVLSNAALGDAIVAYHRAHWNELGVDYLIWQQRMLSSPDGSWKGMENRGSATANHYDHVHVNYRG
ncbi:hypothetical protein [Blastococcus xanthinilyticus]|uniref:ARB-07466-like C-terminal domain-containing protein n=1 Tax=Blastococcus xanthinilyticus TaxID=1564164 RepID=A0A5S5CYQ0_9ACTN|nr:hypothetical protein [Blastococcus xanthinilyticus]TYP88897.1 hypothetical protein BD833_10353 [Blastococcus xanthinilyticus]